MTFYLVLIVGAAAALYFVTPAGKSAATASALAPASSPAASPTQTSSGYAPADNADYRGSANIGGSGGYVGSYGGPGGYGGYGGPDDGN